MDSENDIWILIEQTLRLGQHRNLSQKNSDGDDTKNALRVLVSSLLEIVEPFDAQDSTSGNVVAALTQDLGPYLSMGLSRSEAVVWKAFKFSPEQACGWIEQNIPLATAIVWKEIKPANYFAWVQEGFDVSTAKEWESRGYSPSEAKLWGKTHAWEELEKYRHLGPVECIAPLLNKYYLDPEEVVDWVTSDIPARDAVVWVEKGYTVTQAQKLHAENKTPQEEPDKRGGDLFVTTSWKRINKAANENGWQVSPPRKAMLAQKTSTKTLIFLRGSQRYYGMFSTHGQFRGATAASPTNWKSTRYDPGRMRTVDAFIDALSSPK